MPNWLQTELNLKKPRKPLKLPLPRQLTFGLGGFNENNISPKGFRWIYTLSNFLLEMMKFMPRAEAEEYLFGKPSPLSDKAYGSFQSEEGGGDMGIFDPVFELDNLSLREYFGMVHRTMNDGKYWGVSDAMGFANLDDLQASEFDHFSYVSQGVEIKEAESWARVEYGKGAQNEEIWWDPDFDGEADYDAVNVNDHRYSEIDRSQDVVQVPAADTRLKNYSPFNLYSINANEYKDELALNKRFLDQGEFKLTKLDTEDENSNWHNQFPHSGSGVNPVEYQEIFRRARLWLAGKKIDATSGEIIDDSANALVDNDDNELGRPVNKMNYYELAMTRGGTFSSFFGFGQNENYLKEKFLSPIIDAIRGGQSLEELIVKWRDPEKDKFDGSGFIMILRGQRPQDWIIKFSGAEGQTTTWPFRNYGDLLTNLNVDGGRLYYGTGADKRSLTTEEINLLVETALEARERYFTPTGQADGSYKYVYEDIINGDSTNGLYLSVLMLESRRRIYAGLTELVGPSKLLWDDRYIINRTRSYFDPQNGNPDDNWRVKESGSLNRTLLVIFFKNQHSMVNRLDSFFTPYAEVSQVTDENLGVIRLPELYERSGFNFELQSTATSKSRFFLDWGSRSEPGLSVSNYCLCFGYEFGYAGLSPDNKKKLRDEIEEYKYQEHYNYYYSLAFDGSGNARSLQSWPEETRKALLDALGKDPQTRGDENWGALRRYDRKVLADFLELVDSKPINEKTKFSANGVKVEFCRRKSDDSDYSNPYKLGKLGTLARIKNWFSMKGEKTSEKLNNPTAAELIELKEFISDSNGKFNYNETSKDLVVEGIMTETERDRLKACFELEEGDNKKAITRLFNRSQVYIKISGSYYRLVENDNPPAYITKLQLHYVDGGTDHTLTVDLGPSAGATQDHLGFSDGGNPDPKLSDNYHDHLYYDYKRDQWGGLGFGYCSSVVTGKDRDRMGGFVNYLYSNIFSGITFTGWDATRGGLSSDPAPSLKVMISEGASANEEAFDFKNKINFKDNNDSSFVFNFFQEYSFQYGDDDYGSNQELLKVNIGPSSNYSPGEGETITVSNDEYRGLSRYDDMTSEDHILQKYPEKVAVSASGEDYKNLVVSGKFIEDIMEIFAAEGCPRPDNAINSIVDLLNKGNIDASGKLGITPLALYYWTPGQVYFDKSTFNNIWQTLENKGFVVITGYRDGWVNEVLMGNKKETVDKFKEFIGTALGGLNSDALSSKITGRLVSLFSEFEKDGEEYKLYNTKDLADQNYLYLEDSQNTAVECNIWNGLQTQKVVNFDENNCYPSGRPKKITINKTFSVDSGAGIQYYSPLPFMNMLKDYREKYFSGLDGSQTQTVLGNLLEIFYNNWETFELPESGFAIPDDFKQRLITPPQGLPPVLAQNGDQIEILTTQAVHSLKEVGGYLDGLKENFNNFITGNINQILNYGYASTFKSYWGESYFYQNALPAFFDHRDGSDFDYGELAQDENAGRKAGCSRFYWRWLCDNGWFAPREVSRVVFADDQILNQVISNLNPDAPSPNAYENLTNDGRNYWQEPDHLIFSNSLDAYFSYQQQPRPDFLAGGDQNERGYGRESITSWDRTSGNYLSNLVPERNGVPAGASHFRYTIDSAPAFREYNEGLSYNNLTFYVPQEINSHWGSGIKIDPLQPPAWYKGPRELWLNALYYGEDVTYSGKNITGYDPLTGSGGYETEIDDVKNIALENTLSAFWQASYGGEARTLEETFKLADYSWPTNMLAYLGKMAGSYTANMFIIRDFNKRERKKYDTAMTKWEEECDQAWLDYAQGLKKEAERKSAEARLLARERARMSTVKKEEIVRLYRKAASRRAEERRQQSKQKKI